MQTRTQTDPSTAYKTGWWTLLILSVLSLINHVSLLFFIPGEEVLFLGWAGFNILSTAVIYIPYRRMEAWAWWATWGLILPYALTFVFGADIGLYYLVAAGIMAAAQLLTRREMLGR